MNELRFRTKCAIGWETSQRMCSRNGPKLVGEQQSNITQTRGLTLWLHQLEETLHVWSRTMNVYLYVESFVLFGMDIMPLGPNYCCCFSCSSLAASSNQSKPSRRPSPLTAQLLWMNQSWKGSLYRFTISHKMSTTAYHVRYDVAPNQLTIHVFAKHLFCLPKQLEGRKQAEDIWWQNQPTVSPGPCYLGCWRCVKVAEAMEIPRVDDQYVYVHKLERFCVFSILSDSA